MASKSAWAAAKSTGVPWNVLPFGVVGAAVSVDTVHGVSIENLPATDGIHVVADDEIVACAARIGQRDADAVAAGSEVSANGQPAFGIAARGIQIAENEGVIIVRDAERGGL